MLASLVPAHGRRQRRLVLALLAALGAATWCASGTASEAAELRAFTENLPPLNHAVGEEPRGFSVELLQMMARQAGIPLEIEVLPWVRALQLAQSQPPTVLFSLTRTAERENQYAWVGPISPRRIVIYCLATRKDLRTLDLRRLGQARIGVVRESATARQMIAEGLRPGEELELALDDASNLRKLLAGRMEYIALLDWAAAWNLQQLDLPYSTLQPVLDYDVDKSYWFGLHPKTDPALVQRLQAALETLRRDGRYEQLRQRYFR